MGIADLDLTFEADFNFEDYTAKGTVQPPPAELKPGGAGQDPLCCRGGERRPTCLTLGLLRRRCDPMGRGHVR